MRRLRVTARRAVLAVVAATIATTDLLAKGWAGRELASGGVELGVVDLRLAQNAGVAFSVAADAPAGLVIAVTAVITIGVAVVAALAAHRTEDELAAASPPLSPDVVREALLSGAGSGFVVTTALAAAAVLVALLTAPRRTTGGPA